MSRLHVSRTQHKHAEPTQIKMRSMRSLRVSACWPAPVGCIGDGDGGRGDRSRDGGRDFCGVGLGGGRLGGGTGASGGCEGGDEGEQGGAVGGCEGEGG